VGENTLTGNVDYIWDVFLTVYRGEIGDRSPGDAIGVSCHAYDANVCRRGEVLDCIHSVIISASIYGGQYRSVSRRRPPSPCHRS